MQTSLLVAEIYGLVAIIAGLAMFFNTGAYMRMIEEYSKSYALIYLGGIFALTIGIVLIKYHNIWSSDWRVLITLIAWIAFIKGCILVVAPQVAMRMTEGFLKYPIALRVAGLSGIVFGGFLLAKASDDLLKF